MEQTEKIKEMNKLQKQYNQNVREFVMSILDLTKTYENLQDQIVKKMEALEE